ncbi:MAG TPA: carboxypeptidase-like regulatory domain-containing protein, partial [Kofleriaceae bacterium]|nr:carboxypeptidase-like regulatory domain-containing protein [Kofleriaceae bacterium]
MSEEQPPSAPEQPAPAPSPAPEPQADPAPVAPRKRLVILGGAGLVLIALAVVLIVVFGRKHGATTHPLVVRNDGGAAIHAPIGPKIPGKGIGLTGVVVDGAGLPVEGATIEAELEKGMPDRALATADAGVPAAAGDAGVAASASSPTGSDGKFVVDGLDAGRYRLRVTGMGLLAAEVRMVPVPSDELRIVVARQVDITGIVTDDG